MDSSRSTGRFHPVRDSQCKLRGRAPLESIFLIHFIVTGTISTEYLDLFLAVLLIHNLLPSMATIFRQFKRHFEANIIPENFQATDMFDFPRLQ